MQVKFPESTQIITNPFIGSSKLSENIGGAESRVPSDYKYDSLSGPAAAVQRGGPREDESRHVRDLAPGLDVLSWT